MQSRLTAILGANQTGVLNNILVDLTFQHSNFLYAGDRLCCMCVLEWSFEVQICFYIGVWWVHNTRLLPIQIKTCSVGQTFIYCH